MSSEVSLSAMQLAYLAVVLGAYAVFMVMLGVVWVRSASAPRAPQPRAEVTPAHVPATARTRRRPDA